MELKQMLPQDFKCFIYENIEQQINSSYNGNRLAFTEFNAAWKAVLYRYIQCSKCSATFSNLIDQDGDSPSRLKRYSQEVELFNFFMSGLSAIDSLYYSLYAFGSLKDPNKFPFMIPKKLLNINPKATTDAYLQHYKNESLSIIAEKIYTSHDFKEWKNVRNVLAHRTSPGRTFDETRLGSNLKRTAQPASWINGITIDNNTTSQRLNWLTDALNDILVEFSGFIMQP